MSDESGGAPGVPPAATPEQEPMRSRAWIWIVVAVVVVLVAVAAYASTQGSDGGGLLLLFRGKATVPLLVGLEQAQAEAALSDAGLRVGQVSDSPTLAVAPGTVVSQSPTATTVVAKDSAVDISASSIPQVEVPDVTGQTESAASATLAEEGLLMGPTTYVYDLSVEAGHVKSQEPQPGTEATIGTAVALTVSKGQETGQVPNVVGLSQNDAQSTLTGAGFKVTTTQATNADVPAGDVISQSPAAGALVAAGSTVTITVSKGAPAAPATPSTPATPGTPTSPAEPTPPATPKATVPNVVGMGALEAVRALKSANLKFSIEFGPAMENYLKVAAQDPKAGTEVDPGTSVTITIGLPSFTLGGGGGTGGSGTPPAPGTPTVTPLPSKLATTSGSSATTP